MKEDLRGLEAVHDMGSFRNTYASEGADGINEGHKKFGSAVWPIVRVHPVTGEECLFVNEGFTVHVVGMMADESRR
jgi:taurine dioxygenase